MHEHERKLLTAMRRALVASIRKRLRPLVRPSEYRREVVERRAGSRSGGARGFRLGKASSPALHSFDAFCVDGVVLARGSMAGTWFWRGFSVEDLLLIDAFLARAVEKGQLA